MSFHWATWKSLFLAGFTLGALAVAQAQSAGPGQQILFSTPEGEIVSNTAAPVVQAPESQEMADLPDGAPVSAFNVRLPQVVYPAPEPIMVPRGSMTDSRSMEDPLDPMGQRKILSFLTPAKIMGVPTAQQIFGLPDSGAGNILKNAASMPNEGSTNILSGGEASSEGPGWAKILAENAGQNTSDSSKAEKSHGLLEGFFNGPPEDSLFGNQDKNPASSGFGTSLADETASGQSPFDSSLAAATRANSSPNSSPATLNSSLNPSSPFSLPQSSSLGTLPPLPTLPSVPGQNFTPLPAPPSWEPKPAPWLSSVPPPGTMQPRKF